jgi:predicted nucleic acid-binding protein
MKRYILDSNILSALEDSESPEYTNLFNKLSSLKEEDEVCVSIISLYEYNYGIFNAPDKGLSKQLQRAKETLLKIFKIIPLSLRGAELYGKIKAEYKKRNGHSRSDMKRHNIDIILASTAIEQDAVIVSKDKIFSKIHEINQDLQFENWGKSGPPDL